RMYPGTVQPLVNPAAGIPGDKNIMVRRAAMAGIYPDKPGFVYGKAAGSQKGQSPATGSHQNRIGPQSSSSGQPDPISHRLAILLNTLNTGTHQRPPHQAAKAGAKIRYHAIAAGHQNNARLVAVR